MNSSPRSWVESPNSSPKAGPSSAQDDDTSGYNSGDEHVPREALTEAEWAEVMMKS